MWYVGKYGLFVGDAHAGQNSPLGGCFGPIKCVRHLHTRVDSWLRRAWVGPLGVSLLTMLYDVRL